MEIFTIDVLKIKGECYCTIEGDKVTVSPIYVDSNTTTIIPITEKVEIKVADTIEELTEELLQLGYTIPDEPKIEEDDNNN